MFVGAFVFVRGFAVLGALQKTIADYGQLTLPSLTNIPVFAWVGGLGVLALGVYVTTKQWREKHVL